MPKEGRAVVKRSTVNRFIELLKHTFDELAVEVPLPRLEQLAIVLHHSMDGGRRLYHTSRHVFAVCESMSPLQTLAGLFHDVVYVQVDDGFPHHVQELLLRFVEEREGEVSIKHTVKKQDRSFDLCLEVFGFQPGQILSPFAGLNEFLSALVAVKELEDYLSVKDLLTIAACIEGTIPFRGLDSEGNGPFEALEDRLSATSREFGLGLTDSEIEAIVKLAVAVANRDVTGFAGTDPGAFLYDTWILLPEANAILWSLGLYSVQDYRQALMKMESFLNALDPETVFHRYKDTPEIERFEELEQRAHRNVPLARDYVGMKLLTMAIVEALALGTGGDAPVSMLLGDTEVGSEEIGRVDHFLPPIAASTDFQYDAGLLSTLESGIASESRFDMPTSPLTAYVYRSLGPDETRLQLAHAKEMFSGQVSPAEFLKGIDRHLVQTIASACSRIAVSRRDALLQWADCVAF